MTVRTSADEALRLARRWRAWPLIAWRGMRAHSAGTHIAALCAACILPMVVVSLLASWRLAEAERDANRVQLLGTVRALSAAIDLKLQKAQTALSALATSPSLSAEVLPAFYWQCAGIAAEHNSWIIVVDPEGNELVNTQDHPGRTGRSLKAPFFRRALETRTFQVSDVFSMGNRNSYQISTYLPVFSDDGSAFVLLMSFKVEEIARVLREQGLPDSWTVSVVDRNGLVVARNRAMDQFEGKPTSAALRAAIDLEPEGTFRSTTLEETQTLAAHTTSAFSGWTVAIGIPVAEVDAPLLRSYGEIGAAAILLLLAGTVLAAVIGRHIANSLGGLSQAALALAQDMPWSPVRSRIREVNDAAAAHEVASQLLRLRERERDVAEALLRDAVDSISEGFVIYDPDDRFVMCNEPYRRLYPRSADAMVRGARFEDIVRAGLAPTDDPDVRDRQEKHIAERLRQHLAASGTSEQRREDGRWLLVSERRTRNGGIAGVRIDITARKRAEAEAEAARARMADWAAAANDWFWETDAEHRFTFFSDEFERKTGIKASALIGRSITDTGGPNIDETSWQNHLATLETHRPFRDFLKMGRTRSGRTYYVSVSGMPVFAPDGAFSGYRGTGRDVTAQIEADHALAQQAEIFATLVDNMPIGVTLVDRDLKLRAFNRLMLDMYDLPPNALQVGDPFERFIRYLAERGEYGPVDVDAAVQERIHAITSSIPRQFERSRANGQIVEIQRVPLPGGGFVTTYVDVTAARRREADLQDIRARLERQAQDLDAALVAAERASEAEAGANAAKSLFLANMSHELRTPLNAILGFSEVMSNAMMGPLDGNYRAYAQDIHASGQYLLRLISDLLDLSKIEAGQMELRDEKVDLAELADECHRLILEKAVAGHVVLEMNVAMGFPSVVADRLRLKQVLLNLLSNAVKFTPAAGLVRMSGAMQDDGAVVLTISDTGIGMREEEIAAALEPFQQVDNALTRRYEGTGLGLPIAKTLIEMHGGQLTIHSRPGEGTDVEIRLPPERVRSQQHGPARAADAS